MKHYRAISFPGLQRSISDALRAKWARMAGSNHRTNWWMDEKNFGVVEQCISEVILKNPEGITNTSQSYSALVGGRFNAQKSHGPLYMAEHPILATLEVTYHVFDNTIKSLKRMKNIEKTVSNALNVSFPSGLDFLVVVFAIESNPKKILQLDTTESRLASICKKVGFERYVENDSFDRDFIFGNDYAVTNIIGGHAIDRGFDAISASSARLESRKYRNLILLETYTSRLRVTDDYYVFRVKGSVGDCKTGHSIDIERFDVDGVPNIVFSLDCIPARPNQNSDCVKCYPRPGLLEIEKHREVVVQKFRVR